MDFTEDADRPGTFDLHWTVSPDWIDSGFIREALKSLVDRAFDSEDCRVLRTGKTLRHSPEMDRTFRSLGFRAVPGGEAGEYRLSKTVEGRLL